MNPTEGQYVRKSRREKIHQTKEMVSGSKNGNRTETHSRRVSRFIEREVGVSSSQIEKWHQKVLSGMESFLKDREKDPLQSELNLAKRQIGELSMENELLKEKSKKQGVFYAGKW